jgi:hypothetical protein
VVGWLERAMCTQDAVPAHGPISTGTAECYRLPNPRFLVVIAGRGAGPPTADIGRPRSGVGAGAREPASEGREAEHGALPDGPVRGADLQETCAVGWADLDDLMALQADPTTREEPACNVSWAECGPGEGSNCPSTATADLIRAQAVLLTAWQ